MFLGGTFLLKYLTIDSTKFHITIDYKSKSAEVAVQSALHVPVTVARVGDKFVNLMKTLKYRSTKKKLNANASVSYSLYFTIRS